VHGRRDRERERERESEDEGDGKCCVLSSFPVRVRISRPYLHLTRPGETIYFEEIRQRLHRTDDDDVNLRVDRYYSVCGGGGGGDDGTFAKTSFQPSGVKPLLWRSDDKRRSELSFFSFFFFR